MEYKRFENTVALRIDKGEEIIKSLEKLSKAENIKLAEISAIGAVDDFTVGVFKADEKKYYSNNFKGSYEIVSLSGTVSTMNDEFYCHLHMSAGDETGRVFGGHLNYAVVSAACEMIIKIINGKVNRKYSSETGLNLFCFE
ncbi:MAG: DNA-binding protein [Clostridiales bacterium]|nr:DNA-binding protein [Clostridiales bacterium]